MSMEKRGVIDENTPQGEGCGQKKQPDEPHTKEAADVLQSHPVNNLIDAVAEQSARNRR